VSEPAEIDPLELRISDLDRERANALLAASMQQGRITPVEFSERCEAVWSARTRAELLTILSDLPGGTPPELARLVLDVPLGHVRRGGDWTVPELIRIAGRAQRTTLDFTDAVIRRPEVVIEVVGVMCAVRVVLPPDAVLDSDGLELVAGTLRHRAFRVAGRGRGGLVRGGVGRAGDGLRRLLPRGSAPQPESVIPVRFVLRGRSTLSSVVVWHPRKAGQPRPPRSAWEPWRPPNT
jgi:hypothetical protein